MQIPVQNIVGLALVAAVVLVILVRNIASNAQSRERERIREELLSVIDPQPAIIVTKSEWGRHHPHGDPDALNVVNRIGKNEYVRLVYDPFESGVLAPIDWHGWDNEEFLTGTGGSIEYRSEVEAFEWVRRVHTKALELAGARSGVTTEVGGL